MLKIMFCSKLFRNIFLFRNCCQIVYMHTVKEILQLKPVGTKLSMQGWVQAIRKHKEIYFVDLIDGSTANRLQVVIEASKDCPSYGSAIKVEGSVIASSHKNQEIEFEADSWYEIGCCSPGYPFEYHQKYSAEYIRQHLHLRPKTRKFSSVLRIRNVASMAVHNFFQEQGFCFIHTPILTKNDCEGAGEVFSIKVNKQGSSQQITSKLREPENPSKEPDEADEFFGSPAFLTVSGQLHLEAMASALSRVYNFGPVFRAENSQTRQHASEFTMVEAELAFINNLDPLLEVVEKCIKRITSSILKNCSPDLKVLSDQNKELVQHMERVAEFPFPRLTYDEACKVLQDNNNSMKSPFKWGDDMSAEHKRCLVQYCGELPVFVSLFPPTLKPFYVKSCHLDENSDKMAQCFDLFAPFGGEICGGSLRVDQEEILLSHEKLKHSNLDWYVDLRRYGSVPHGGFGIGFDRLLQSVLRISNIRDIIPYPRRKHDCKC